MPGLQPVPAHEPADQWQLLVLEQLRAVGFLTALSSCALA